MKFLGVIHSDLSFIRRVVLFQDRKSIERVPRGENRKSSGAADAAVDRRNITCDKQ